MEQTSNFDNLNINSNVLVRCVTEEEAQQVCNIAHKAGLKWADGESYLSNYCWSKEGIYYEFASGSYVTDLSDNNNECQVISAELFLKIHSLKINQVPFNIKDAKSGLPVVTRDGRDVEIVKYDKKGNYPIVGIIEESPLEKTIGGYTCDGLYHKDSTTSADLFIEKPTFVNEASFKELCKELGIRS